MLGIAVEFPGTNFSHQHGLPSNYANRKILSLGLDEYSQPEIAIFLRKIDAFGILIGSEAENLELDFFIVRWETSNHLTLLLT